MIQSMQRRYFEVWGSEEAQNAILKFLLLLISVLFIIQTAAIATLALRKPVLVAVGEQGSSVLTLAPPSSALLASELKRMVRQYVEAHYNWDYTSIEKAHDQASHYVSEKFIKAFLTANAEQVKTVQEKKVNERIYLSGEIQVDREHLSARVPMDRVFSVDGMRATSPLILDIQFEFGSRTEKNPEGIYITGERVVPQGGAQQTNSQ